MSAPRAVIAYHLEVAVSAVKVESDPVSEPEGGRALVQATVLDDARERLVPPMPDDRLRGWLWTGAVAVVAALLRLVGLSHPPGKIFDETYYAKEGFDLLRHGVEWNAEHDTGGFVVHPPLGKWCIALGEWLFGQQGVLAVTTPEFSWRIPSVVAGVASVVILTRLARRMFRSTALGAAAGLLLSLDGMHLVLSRSALLDIFLMLFLLAAFACLVMDREASRQRWLTALEAGVDTYRQRPRRTTWPWWRLAAGVFAGAAFGVKWSALFYIVAFVVVMYIWEARTRVTAGVRRPWRDAFLDEIGWVAAFAGLIAVTYLATWSGWFATDGGARRHWLADNGYAEPPFFGALYNLFQYHWEALTFHTGLDTHHDYQSAPWQWLILGRPVAFYYSSDLPCDAANCAAEVVLLGTPLLWWSFLPALVATVWLAVSRRDWRGWAIVVGAAMGVVPWFAFPDRTMFYFYALPSVPFLVLAVVYVLGAVVGPRDAPDHRRLLGALVAGAYVTLVALCFLYFFPIYVGTPMTYAEWYARMWLGKAWI